MWRGSPATADTSYYDVSFYLVRLAPPALRLPLPGSRSNARPKGT